MTLPVIFIHGQDSSSQTHKAALLRATYPAAIVPDFAGPLAARMAQLDPILAEHDGWAIVGSSMGGLMGALWACAHPAHVRRLILLAPAINLPEFAAQPPPPVEFPVAIYHGTRDTVVPLEPVRSVAERVFRNLAFHVVDDDHRLHATAAALDWRAVLEDPLD